MIGRTLVRRLGWRTVSAALVASMVLVATAGLVEASPSAPRAGAPPVSTSVTITVGSGFTFDPTSFPVNPGDTVTLTFVQSDGTPHNLLIVAEANYTFPSGAGTSVLLAYFTQHPPLVNLSLGAAPTTATTTFIAPHKGLYQFVCTQSGHFAAGMMGYMGSGGVTIPGQGYSGPGAPVFIIGGTIAGLVLLAIVLAFVIGRRRGSMHEMPPERLGYAEGISEATKGP
ncbi:MAG: plastocyanin/azurin family copper-binding protein [Thermoplasmata archaeon]|nr:plastocyanin/azurin family copper-binding protein [Thermoplasmata archaeon]